MRTSNHLVVLAALLFVAGCSSEESAAPMSPALELQASTSALASHEADPPGHNPGLAVGEQAPAFELQDQHDQPQTLVGILESGSVALVFYRSADW